MNKPGTKELKLHCGPVIVRCDEGLLYARGIKYAQAERFRDPIPATWTSVRDCTGPATIPPQLPARLKPIIGDYIEGRSQSEDCLHVTVASPIDAKQLPVMVFLHGGAYVGGGGDLDAYNPCGLAREGVVAVNVSYRVGILGYLPIRGIARANLGLLDQIEALKWIQNNISSFGGDPAQVTIYGHSAGGDSIVCMLLCEQARALFHRCIIMSAPMGRFDETEQLRDQVTYLLGEGVFNAINSSKQPLSTDECLALLPHLMAVARTMNESIIHLAPVLGEYPLPPKSQMNQILQEAVKHIPVFVGITADDGSAYAMLDPSHTAAWYQKKVFEDGSERLRDKIAAVTGKCPFYKFVWHPDGRKWGAAHCVELPFLLGGIDGWRSAPMLDGCDKEAILNKLGPEMKKLWIAFARGADLGDRRFVIDSDFVFDE